MIGLSLYRQRQLIGTEELLRPRGDLIQALIRTAGYKIYSGIRERYRLLPRKSMI